MKYCKTLAFIFLLVLGVATAWAQQSGVSTSTGLKIQDCQVSLIDDVAVSAQESGLLVNIRTEQGGVVRVQEGQDVQRGMVLAQIDDRQAWLEKSAAEAELKAARARADNDINVRFSEAAYRVAQAEYQAALSVNSRVDNTVPQSEVRRLELTQHKSRLEIDRSKMEQTIAGLSAEVNQARVNSTHAAILRRRVTSPVDGLILTLFKQPGEWVEAGEPVVRVARMNNLRVQGFVSAQDYNPAEINGCDVTVFVDLARGRKETLPGKVVFVSPLVQAGNRYLVRAEVENRSEAGNWLLRPGMTAEVQVHTR